MNQDHMIEERMVMNLSIKTVDNCFNECVKDFRQDQLAAHELTCIKSCASRAMNLMPVMMDSM